MLQSRGITVVIPEKSDEIARRKAKGCAGGRPPDFDTEDYKNRNVVERAFNQLKNWRGLATRYDKRPDLPRQHGPGLNHPVAQRMSSETGY